MTQQLCIYEGEIVSDTPDLTTVDIIHSEALWVVQIRESDEHPWVDYGTHKSAWEEQLRVYDYRQKNCPESQARLVRATVLRSIEDPEKLREILRQKAVEEESSGLQSN